MLNSSRLMGFVATAQPTQAREFYETVLGLRLLEDSPFALVFAANGTMLRVQKVASVSPHGYTALGWEVGDIVSAVRHLAERGVKFEHYEGLPQDEAGIWRTPDGSSVAWFRDPDGNILSLSQHPAG